MLPSAKIGPRDLAITLDIGIYEKTDCTYCTADDIGSVSREFPPVNVR
jgi:hypothetical protein